MSRQLAELKSIAGNPEQPDVCTINPYRAGKKGGANAGNYYRLFNMMMTLSKGAEHRPFTKAQLLGAAKSNFKMGETECMAHVGVLLSPTKQSDRGDCRGNFSAQGWAYYVDRVEVPVKGGKKNAKGEVETETRYQLFARNPIMERHVRPDVKKVDPAVKAAKAEAKAAKMAAEAEAKAEAKAIRQQAKAEKKAAKNQEKLATKAAKAEAKAEKKAAKELAKTESSQVKAVLKAEAKAAKAEAKALKQAEKAKAKAEKAEAKAKAKAEKDTMPKVPKAPKTPKAPKAKKPLLINTDENGEVISEIIRPISPESSESSPATDTTETTDTTA